MDVKVIHLTEYAMALLDIISIKMYTIVDGTDEAEFTFDIGTEGTEDTITVYVSVLNDDSFMTRIYPNGMDFELTTEARELLEVKLTQVIREMMKNSLEVKEGGVLVKCFH